MFERGKAIREAKKAELLAKERRKGREEGRAEVTDRLKVLLEIARRRPAAGGCRCDIRRCRPERLLSAAFCQWVPVDGI